MEKQQRALAIAARAKLRKLTTHCDPSCPGWAVFEKYDSGGKLEILSCIDCWHGWIPPLYDEEAAALPEAQALLAQEEQRRQREEATDALMIATGGVA